MNSPHHLTVLQPRYMEEVWNRPTPSDWVGVLAKFPLFGGVRKRRLRQLVRSATVVEFAPGEPVLFGDEPRDALYIILAGKARVLPQRRRPVLRTGDYFGDLALKSTIIAASELHVLRLPSSAIHELARKHPSITLTLLEKLARELSSFEPRRVALER